jgi:hypothetical protein
MKTYVACIGEEAVLAFRAENDDEAHEMIDDEEGSIRSDLKVLVGTDEKPLWDGKSAIVRGALYYLLSNHFYIGEVKYKNEILPGEQPSIMDRALFESVRQKSLVQWSHRTVVRNNSDHLLTGLLFDDSGHRVIPTHATKAGVRYRYYVSTPFLHGEAKTASAGSVPRVPAADIEDIVVKFLKEHLAARQNKPTASAVGLEDRAGFFAK